MSPRRSRLLRGVPRTCALAVLFALTASSAALAQQGANWSISDGVVNAGGHAEPLSPPLLRRVTRPGPGSVGEGALGVVLAGLRFRVEGGFLAALRPPTEVRGVRLTGPATLRWDGEPSTGTYNVYRSLTDQLPADYGSCLAPGLAGTTLTDATPCPRGRAFFYLVTAVNRLGEEGTRGPDSRGVERVATTPCP